MAILYNAKAKTITLQTKRTTYQMKIAQYGVLQHTYYGERVFGDDLSGIWQGYNRGFSGNPNDAGSDRTFSLDQIPQEYASLGVGDYRIAPVLLENGDGSAAADFRYVRHEISAGKYALPGLPALFAKEEEAQTLTVTLEDRAGKSRLDLFYGVLEGLDVITRTARLTNLASEPLRLKKLASLCLDLPFGPWELTQFHGRHNMERIPERSPLPHAITAVGSTRGASSHQHNPFLLLSAPDATEIQGDCLGVALVYSGGFLGEAEVDQYDSTRVLLGIQPQGFCFTLKKDESFTAPEVVMSFSANGFAALTHQFHDVIRDHLCRGKFAHSARPVLVNSWEASFFDIHADSLVKLAKSAAKIGVDLLVMDDGWFTNRNNDCAGLGDWEVDEGKLPGGLAELARRVNAEGLQLGIWVEPEMVSERSGLFEQHPDWALQVPGRPPVRSRFQLVLDLSRPQVCDYLYEKISSVLESAPITYLKWDMNRSISDVWSAALSPECQGETAHRYMLGLYDLLERLTQRFPQVLFEGCSGGGGRFDAGMLYYTPQIWCSDDTDAIERLTIQYGTSFAYPVCTMGAHVSVSPNQQTGRCTPLATRGAVAMCGTFGYEMDLSLTDQAQQEEMAAQVRRYKSLQALIFGGDYYRLTNPEKDVLSACQFVSKDRRESLAVIVHLRAAANGLLPHLRLRGLDPDLRYEMEDGTVLGGDALMRAGYTLPVPRSEYAGHCLRLRAL